MKPSKRICGAGVAIGFAATLLGCGASVGPPVERLASTDAAIRSARELGATSDPQASLYLKLADDQAAQARRLINTGDNDAADRMLMRARSDAELSVMLTRERAAKTQADQSKERLEDERAHGGTVR
jgi:hypothetical protein